MARYQVNPDDRVNITYTNVLAQKYEGKIQL